MNNFKCSLAGSLGVNIFNKTINNIFWTRFTAFVNRWFWCLALDLSTPVDGRCIIFTANARPEWKYGENSFIPLIFFIKYNFNLESCTASVRVIRSKRMRFNFETRRDALHWRAPGLNHVIFYADMTDV